MLTTKKFWLGCFECAIKTAAQTFVASVGVDATGIVDVDWPGIASVTALAALLSVVTAIGNAEFTAGGRIPAVAAPDAFGPPETDDIDPETGEPMISEDAGVLPDPDGDIDDWIEVVVDADSDDDLEAMVTATRVD